MLYDDDTQSTDPASVEFFVYNAVGSTVALSDYSSAVTQSTLYEAFGETVSQTGGSTNNRLRNTKERDASIGLDNDAMQYYDRSAATSAICGDYARFVGCKSWGR